MISYLKSGNKQMCFGCGACAQICPRRAIEMQEDEEGFLYPKVIPARCINCGLCRRACPVEAEHIGTFPSLGLVGFVKENSARKESASGGAFPAIIKSVPEDAVVFGAAWKNRSEAVHDCEPAIAAYERFHKSKYVQSLIGDSYKQCKALLEAGRRVIFTGTPCQIAGLQSYLGKRAPNLLCVDLVCHGVPSSRVLENYLQEYEQKCGRRIQRIDFRCKHKRSGEWDSKCAEIHFEDGGTQVTDYDTNAFLRGFANGLFFRPSCSICPFARTERISDLTIGDAWGAENYVGLNPHEGVSMILINSTKGAEILPALQKEMQLEEVPVHVLAEGNARLRAPDRGNPHRGTFFAEYADIGIIKEVNRIVPRVSSLRKLAHKIKKRLKRL